LLLTLLLLWLLLLDWMRLLHLLCLLLPLTLQLVLSVFASSLEWMYGDVVYHTQPRVSGVMVP
jgi:hypothetical protein